MQASPGILEGGHSQEQTPVSTPENLVIPIARTGKLTRENMKLLAKRAVHLGTRH
jgi:hypothetical protein